MKKPKKIQIEGFSKMLLEGLEQRVTEKNKLF
jgi:hypothetical protein